MKLLLLVMTGGVTNNFESGPTTKNHISSG